MDVRLTMLGERANLLHERERPSNNGLQLTRSARCAPSPSDGGQSLRAALAAEPGCSAPSWSQETDLLEAMDQEYPALSARERRGHQPRSKAALSRFGWSGVQPRQRASSSASDAGDSHPPRANHFGSGAQLSSGFKKTRLLTSVKGSLFGLRVGRPKAHLCASTSHEGRLSLWHR